MWADDAAVGGFFEDLPVLAFVLAGVLVIVLSSVSVSSQTSQERIEAELDMAARQLVLCVLDCIRGSSSDSSLPMIHSIEGLGLAEVVAESAISTDYSFSVVELYPEAVRIAGGTRGSPERAVTTGCCSALFNARGNMGEVHVLEVSAIVWQA